VRCGVLGPLEVRGDDGQILSVPGAKERLLLAVLAAAYPAPVSVDQLLESLWDGAPPRTGRKSLQAHVVRLRTALEPGRPPGLPGRYVVRRHDGYALAIDQDRLDATAFADLATRGRGLLSAGDAAAADVLLLQALDLWRGRPYCDWPDATVLDSERERLEGVRAHVEEAFWEAELALGRHVEAVPELGRLVQEQPLQEGWWALHALALYRSGRQGEALAAIRGARRVLADELGIEPGVRLRELERSILAQDPCLDLAAASPRRSAHASAVDAVTGGLARPDLPAGPHRDLVDALHDLHHRAGWPSLRVLARDIGVSHTTVSKVFSSPRLPTWGTLELLVEAMHGDPRHVHDLWLAASTPTAGTAQVRRIAGRRAELTALRRHLETGTGLLLVTGEAGIGKTTLVDAAAAASAALVAVGRCLPLAREVPLMPVVDLLGHIHGVDDRQWSEQALGDCPAYVRVAMARLLPDLESGAPEPPDELERQHLFTAVARFLSALSQAHPVAIVVEDLHWADTATRDLLEHLVVNGPGVPVTATWRTDDPDVSAGHREWMARVRRLGSTSEVRLSTFTQDETREQLLLEAGIDDADTIAHIHSRSRGQPLFTSHLAGQPRDADGHLPRQLAELLDHRLEGLRADAARVATALGVADRDCALDLLEAATGLGHDRVVDALHELTTRHLLASDQEGGARLGHPLLAEAARRRLVPGEAADWHHALATSMSAHPSANAAEVAEHWRKAGEPREELEWRVRAAGQAHHRTAPAAEAAQWSRVLEIHAHLPDSGLDTIHARLSAFDAFELSGEVEAARDVVRVAMDDVELLEDHLGAEVLRRVAMAETWLSEDTTRCLSLAARAVQLLTPHPPSEPLVHCLDLRANQLINVGRYDEALADLRRALRVADDLHDDGLYFGTAATLAWYLAHRGDLEAALSVVDEARTRVPGSAGPRREAYMAMMHTDALIQHRRPAEEVRAAAERAVLECGKRGMDFHYLTLARANIVEALANTGRTAEAAAELPGIPVSHRYDHWPVIYMSGQLAIAQGRPTEGLAHFRDLKATGPTPETDRARCIAVAHLWLGQPEDAWAELLPALQRILNQLVIGDAGEGFLVAARAGADLAAIHPNRAAELHEVLTGLRQRAEVDPLGPGPAPITRAAATAQWEAELARLLVRDAVEQWVRAGVECDGLRSPHDAAYCRWRAAQCALRDGHGTAATRLLKRAAADAREHVPLSQSIALTSGQR
jgi:DNA-binding SARP family transcriptional activator/tetratricopeptide (TPR) repeat protein